MMLAEVRCMFMGVILYISAKRLWGQANICALKGSSVDLPCSAANSTSVKIWYTQQWIDYEAIQNEISADGKRVSYHISEDSNLTLTINNLTESDEDVYYCRDSTVREENSWLTRVQLRVADLQVKVIPNTEGNTVTLMCSTSCPLTDIPAAYIWYKNGEFLYEDWFPWYQQLVSSEEDVTYSCAIKGYEDLRAPDVSVDSVTSTCFNVTYAKGRMCSYKQRSVDEPCTITYPREVHVQRTATNTYFTLSCITGCPLIGSQTAYKWYQNGLLNRATESHQILVSSSPDKTFSCAVKGFKHLLSAEVCLDEKSCWSVNYVSRRICALQGSAVNISSKYSHPGNQQPKSKVWYKVKRSTEHEELIEAAGRKEYHDNVENQHVLRITNLKKYDSAEYKFSLQRNEERPKQSHLPGVTLVVTGLEVRFTPSAVVTAGQRVTLTCSTSCPLTDDTNYIWYLNSQPLALPRGQNKQMVLDPVSSQHSGNYSCAVQTHNIHISTHEKTLTVQATWNSVAVVNVVRLSVVPLIPIPLLVFHLWMSKSRKKKSLTSTFRRNHRCERSTHSRRTSHSRSRTLQMQHSGKSDRQSRREIL